VGGRSDGQLVIDKLLPLANSLQNARLQPVGRHGTAETPKLAIPMTRHTPHSHHGPGVVTPYNPLRSLVGIGGGSPEKSETAPQITPKNLLLPFLPTTPTTALAPISEPLERSESVGGGSHRTFLAGGGVGGRGWGKPPSLGEPWPWPRWEADKAERG
jgi:hypothetical protein